MNDIENKVITLYDLHPQEEIFVQYYINTGSSPISAYWANMLDNIKGKKSYDELTLSDIKNLRKVGNLALKKPVVKERISQLVEKRAKENSISDLDELLRYLTTVIRQSKENLNNIPLINSAIRAIELLSKRYPEFQGKEDTTKNEKYNFYRFKKE